MAISADGLTLAALSGLTGAPHCFVMCGGIVSSFALRSKGTPIMPALAYNAGRIATYAAIGGCMGLAGSFLDTAGIFVGIQGAASMIGGLFILLWAFRRYTLPGYRTNWLERAPWRAKLAAFQQRYELLAIFATGLMMGFLPCGLTYAMQMNAAASGSAEAGFLIMLVFGLATFPILLLTALSASALTKKRRKRMRQAGAYLAYIMGILSIMKGLSANGWIPSVHPWLW